MIDLYYAPTPNGWKIAIALEELRDAIGLESRVIPMRLTEGPQFAPEFLEISPNAKMPAILDRAPPGGGAPVPVFESGAILLYLAERTGRFAPPDALAGDLRARKELWEWLFWQSANQGPMMGQLSHFRNYAPKAEAAYGLKRYHGEAERCLAVLERRLAPVGGPARDFMLGAGAGAYSVADMHAFPWAFIAKPLGIDLAAFPAVAAWRARIKERPAVRRAIDLHKDEQNRGRATAETNSLLYNQSAEHFRRRDA